MKALRLLWKVIRATDADRLVMSLLALVLVVAALLVAVEPTITSYGDALWYCFSTITTIGFGDVVATTVVGRVLTIIVGLSGIVAIGLVTGIVVAFYNETIKLRNNESVAEFADKLEHLPELSHDELADLSEQFKRSREKHMGGRGRGSREAGGTRGAGGIRGTVGARNANGPRGTRGTHDVRQTRRDDGDRR